MNTTQSTHKTGSVTGVALEQLTTAARLSELIRAKIAPLDQLAWDLDDAAAVIRRHQNGAGVNIGGTPEEQRALADTISRAKASLNGTPANETLLLATISALAAESAGVVAGLLGVLDDNGIELDDCPHGVVRAVDQFNVKLALTHAALKAISRT